jgi:hypothetical protein
MDAWFGAYVSGFGMLWAFRALVWKPLRLKSSA